MSLGKKEKLLEKKVGNFLKFSLLNNEKKLLLSHLYTIKEKRAITKAKCVRLIDKPIIKIVILLKTKEVFNNVSLESVLKIRKKEKSRKYLR